MSKARMNCLKKLLREKRTTQSIIKRCVSDDRLSRRTYWKNRYDTPCAAFDWLTNPVVTVQSVLPYLDDLKMMDIATCNLLDLGCGNSKFPAELLKHVSDKTTVFCLDYTLESLELQRRYTSPIIADNDVKSKVVLVCGDAGNLPFKSNMMHLVIDKGTTDSLLKDKENGKQRCMNTLLEVIRVLVPSGKLLQFTDEDPDIRLALLEQISNKHDIAISYKILTMENFEYFMYCINLRESS